MKYFDRINAESFEQAEEEIRKSDGKAQAMAGGSDLLGVYKDRILENYPEVVVNLKTIPDMDKMETTGDSVVIGAGCKLSKIAADEEIQKSCPALAEAAHSVASPLIRNIGTIGGNVCQDVRCWYYRYPDSVGNALNCKRKGGKTCYAINGENRYHSVFGGMNYHTSPCVQSCPAGTDIPAYMALLRKGDWDGAARIIMKYNPMPMVTSRICPHLCQDDCNQCTYGDSVNVHGVERSLGDYILEHAKEYFCIPKINTGKTVSIIGAGPGGLSAAYYLRKAGNEVVIYDRMEKAGGVLRYGIPHYRLPKTIVDAYVKAIESMGVTFKLGIEVGKDIKLDEIQKKSDKMFFSTGAWRQPILGLEGEKLTQFGLNFLVDVNTYLEKAIGNHVLVCGGGNVAMDVALTAVRLGAKDVKLVCLEQENEMPATKEEVARAKEEGVTLYNGWGLGKIVTDADGKVSGLEAMKCLSVFDENHRFSPVYDEKERQVMESDYIILATGQRVDTDFLGETFEKQLKSARGLIDANLESYQTNQADIYAGGDAVTGPNIAIRAIRAGRIAASNMNKDMGVAVEPLHNTKDATETKSFLHFDTKGIEAVHANTLNEVPLNERTLTKEDAVSFDIETTLKEAKRCMNCGCYAVSPSDITPVLVMMDAKIVTTKQEISAKELFTKELTVQDILEPGELVKEIKVPKMKGIMHYDKKRVRDAIDFAIVSLASCFEVENGSIKEARLVFGGVAPIPYRMEEVEKLLKGQKVTKELAERAAELAIKDATPMGKNEYKLFMMKDLLSSAILRAAK